MYELSEFLAKMEKDSDLIRRLEEAYDKDGYNGLDDETGEERPKCTVKDLINIHIHNHIYGVCRCSCNMCKRMDNIVTDHIHNEFRI